MTDVAGSLPRKPAKGNAGKSSSSCCRRLFSPSTGSGEAHVEAEAEAAATTAFAATTAWAAADDFMRSFRSKTWKKVEVLREEEEKWKNSDH